MNHTIPQFIITRRTDAVGTISLNRPVNLNTFNLEMAQQFLSAVENLRQDDEIRVVVVRGEGRVFSAGGDIPEMLGYVREGKDRAAYFREPLAAFGKIVLAMQNLPKPVVAAVHGAVAGYAFNLMLACDLKLAEEKTRFNQAFIKVGLSPDGGGTWFLPRYVGFSRACELALLPAELDAKTARDWGLINWIAPADRFEKRLQEIVQSLVNSPREALARTKALIYSAYDRTMADHIEAERLAQVENAASPDFEEGLTAFWEKRAPRF